MNWDDLLEHDELISRYTSDSTLSLFPKSNKQDVGVLSPASILVHRHILIKGLRTYSFNLF